MAVASLPKQFWCVISTAFVCLAISTPSLKAENPTELHDGSAEWLNECDAWDDWDKPSPPYKIYGNTYYVGTCGITALLVTGEQGHVLLDVGTEAGGEVVATNIAVLGFKVEDVKILLHSHEHFDHVAGLARLQRLSGAELHASPHAVRVIETGIVSDQDPQAGMHDAFPSAKVSALVRDGETVSLGNKSLLAIATPGHSPGALSWQWQECEGEQCKMLVYADSLSPVSSEEYRFSGHPDYLAKYREGLVKLGSVDCDILLTPHPSASQMVKRLQESDGLVDSRACTRYAATISERLDKRLEKEHSLQQNNREDLE